MRIIKEVYFEIIVNIFTWWAAYKPLYSRHYFKKYKNRLTSLY